MLPRLIRSLYKAIDADPHAEVAFRVSHPQGFAWTIADRTLTATTEADAPIAAFDLTTKTVLQVYQGLLSAGCTGVYLNPDFTALNASVLIDGVGRQSETNGDCVYAYTTLLWAILDTFALALEQAQAQMPEALAQINYSTCAGDYLDLWGEYWGIPRKPNEQDAAYYARTIEEILRPKVNKVAMEKAASKLAGSYIRLFEPWTKVMYLDETPLDEGHLCDASTWNACLFQPQSDGLINVSWSSVKALLNKIKPAGVIMMEPVTLSTARHVSRDEALYPDGWGWLDVRRLDGVVPPDFQVTTETV